MKGNVKLKVVNKSYGHALGKTMEVRKGALVLGSVVQIEEHYVRIMLYRSIQAVLTIREVSDILALEIDHLIGNIRPEHADRLWQYPELSQMPTCKDLFHENQVVRVMVLGGGYSHEDDMHGYRVTMRPSVLNARLTPEDMVPGYPLSASILSVEDKGYTLDCGIEVHNANNPNEEHSKRIKTFLRFKDIPDGVLRFGMITGDESRKRVHRWLSIKSGKLHGLSCSVCVRCVA